MPVFLLLIGALLMVVAVRGNTTYAVTLLKSDVLGKNGFIMWVLAVAVVVSLGNIRALRPATNALLGLIVLVIIVHSYAGNRNLFGDFAVQITDGVSSNGNCGTSAHAAEMGGGGGGLIGTLQKGAKVAQTGAEIAAMAG